MTFEADIKRPENSHIWDREQHEHYVEPEWCSRRLFEVEDFDRSGVMLDPCCGFGRIPTAAMLAGDIVDRGFDQIDRIGNFFDDVPQVASVVCNPPFDQFKKFALRSLQVATSKVAMIWLVRTLPAARWLQDTPLARIWLLTPRPSMPPGHVITRGDKPGGGKQDFCWLVWDKNHEDGPAIGWLHRDGDGPHRTR